MSIALIDVERERGAPVVRGAVVEQAPQPGRVARVLADEQLPRAPADGVGRGHLDHGPGQVRGRVGLPDADEPLVGVHADEERVLGAVGAVDIDLRKADDDRLDVRDAHQNVTVRPPSTVTTWPVTIRVLVAREPGHRRRDLLGLGVPPDRELAVLDVDSRNQSDSSSLRPSTTDMRVFTKPGATAFTSTPGGDSSTASVRVAWFRPALAAS